MHIGFPYCLTSIVRLTLNALNERGKDQQTSNHLLVFFFLAIMIPNHVRKCALLLK